MENDFLLSEVLTIKPATASNSKTAIVNKLILFQILKFYILLFSGEPITTMLCIFISRNTRDFKEPLLFKVVSYSIFQTKF